MHLATMKCKDLRRTLSLTENDKQVEAVITICQKLNLKSNGCLVKFAGNRLRNKLFLWAGSYV